MAVRVGIPEVGFLTGFCENGYEPSGSINGD
jgi:hypothetical protein